MEKGWSNAQKTASGQEVSLSGPKKFEKGKNLLGDVLEEERANILLDPSYVPELDHETEDEDSHLPTPLEGDTPDTPEDEQNDDE